MAGNTSTLGTNFNAGPYWDDFEVLKNFYRFLFKPGMAVQARELTQLQAVLQNQIKSGFDHIFKDGAIVKGGQFSLDYNYSYAKFRNRFNGNLIDITEFDGLNVTGIQSGVEAIVVGTAAGDETEANTNTIFIKYMNSGTDNNTKTFFLSEQVTANTGYSANVVSANGGVGFGSLFSVEEGIVYGKEHFIRFDKQSIVLDRYSNAPSCRVGFRLVEQIIDSDDDYTLLDPAQGSYNYAAPGADRLKLSATLTRYDLTEETPDDFVSILVLKDGIIQEKRDAADTYSLIRDYMAKRTYEESGNYYVNGLDVRIREHLNNGSNLGYLTSEDGGNSSLLAIGVDPGLAYIRGYDIQTLVPNYVSITKGLDYKQVADQVISANYGSYVICDEVVGAWNVNDGVTVSLYSAAQDRISTNGYSTAAQTGTLLGTAKFKAIEKITGVSGVNTTQYKIYIYDVKMSAGDFAAVRSLYIDNTGSADCGADVVLQSGIAVLMETNFGAGVYKIPTDSIRKIRNASDNIDTTYTFMKSFPVTIGTGGTFSVSTGAVDEIYPYSIGALNDDQKNEIVVALNSGADVSLTGTVSATSGNSTISGSSTTFTNLNVGDRVRITNVPGIYKIASITNNTSMTLTSNAANTASGQSIRKSYFAGDIVDFTTLGGTGVEKTISIASSTSANFDMKETLSGSITASVNVILNKTTAREIAKTIRRNRYVKIDCSSAGTTGPFNLGFSDVYKINSIRKKTGAFSTSSEGTDVTSSFTLDNGQRDSLYDHARIIKSPSLSLSSGEHLLINLDYFYHDFSQGVGYFSVDSYPIDDAHPGANTAAITTDSIPVFTSPTTGEVFDLRNVIDTRPAKTNTASDDTTVGGASINPATTTALNVPLGGLKTPAPNEEFVLDYSYYMGRKDLLMLNGLGIFYAVKGVPSLFPITPATPADGMALATIEVPPYPSLSPAYAQQLHRPELAASINKTAFRRYTMRDIGVVDNRLTNLEETVSLTLLQQDTLNLQIMDDAGLNRFKNGIFVDAFASHALGDITNPDYNIAVDSQEESIRPIFEIEDLKIDYLTGTNVVNKNDLIFLNYTQSPLATQPFATTNRNAASQFWNFKGAVLLDPPDDFWVDTNRLPDLQINNTDTNANWNQEDSYEVNWNSWQTVSSGVNTQTSNGGQTTTTTNTQNQVRTGTATTTTFVEEEQSYGDRVVDVSIIPYIRPQTIAVEAYGMKPSTQVFCFFDDEDMSDYCTQADANYVNTKAEGAALITDTDGVVWFNLRLPADTPRFRTGTKKVRVTDSITNEDNATTAGEAYFVAQGLIQQKQETIVATTRAVVTTEQLTETRTVTSTSTQTQAPPTRTINRSYTPPRKGDPLAQTIFCYPDENVAGAFVTSIDLYFQTKDTVNGYGINLELRTVDSAGYITGTVVPYSQVYKSVDNINVSADGSVSTNFEFPCPIFLEADQQYAFVILPESNTPNYNVWTAKLGQNDLITGERVTEQPYSGIMFVSSNNSTWSAIQDEDIKFTLYRAVFATNVVGQATLVNRYFEKFGYTAPSSTFTHFGEPIRGEGKLSFSDVSGGSIANTYIVTANTSGVSGQITNITGGTYRLKNIPALETFGMASDVYFSYANGSPTGITAKVSSENYITGSLYSEKNGAVQFRGTTGTFAVGEQFRGQFSNTAATISSVLPIKYSTMDLESSFLQFENAQISWASKTTANNNVLASAFSPMIINENNTFDVENVVLGRTQEATLLSGNKSLQARATMTTGTDYLSPVIDLNRTHAILVHNIINNDSTGEAAKSGGNAINKYISSKVSLGDNNDAEDILVILTDYKPSTADIKVYAKILHREDSDNFNDALWFELELNGTNVLSNIENKNDWREHRYGFPASMMTGPNGEVTYTNSQGIEFSTYKYFAIKIVLLGDNSAVVPRVDDLRVVAVQL